VPTRAAREAASGSERRGGRPGFTLLELLLATLIASLLLGALYMALNVTLQQTQASRDAVETDTVARGVFNKVSLDLGGTLGPLPPKSGGNAAGSGGTSTAPAPTATPDPGTTPPATGADPNASSTPGGSAAPTDPAAADPNAADPNNPGATDNATAVAADFTFQAGVIGEEKKLVIYTGKVPEAFGHFGSGGAQERSDLRQVIYWFEPGVGLCRQERPWVTADGVRNSIEPDRDAVGTSVLAEEVVDLFFEYFDGTGTSSGTWDGSAAGPDGVTPLGPPRAIRVTLVLSIPVGRGEPVQKQVSQVIPVRAAPGPYTPPLLEAPTDGASEAAPAENPSSDPSNTGMGGNTSPGGNTTPGASTTPAGGATPGGSAPARPPGGTSPGLSLPPGTTLPPGVSMPSGGGRPGGTTPGGAAPGGRPGGTGGGRPSGGGR
jgi:prepilin-type N-terminal cleavage/methylation domain-containing protein